MDISRLVKQSLSCRCVKDDGSVVIFVILIYSIESKFQICLECSTLISALADHTNQFKSILDLWWIFCMLDEL